MNKPVTAHPPGHKAPRHVFTVDDVSRLQDQRYFTDPKRIALHEGDIVEMAQGAATAKPDRNI